MGKRIAVCINETAGKSDKFGHLGFEAFIKIFHEYEVIDISGASIAQANQNAQEAIKQGIDALMVVGGDGMAHFGLNNVIDTNIPLGIVPCGSGNDFVRNLKIPVNNILSVVEGLHAGLKAKTYKNVDAVRIKQIDSPNEQRWFFSALALGLDAKINDSANGSKLPSSLKYKIIGFGETLKMNTYNYDIEFCGSELLSDGSICDEKKYHLQQEGTLACIASSPHVGGGIKIAPFVKCDDGNLHLVFVKPLTRIKAFRLFPIAFPGKHIFLKEVSQYISKKFIVKRGESIPSKTKMTAPIPFPYADGEKMIDLPLEVEIFKEKVPIIIAPRALKRLNGLSL